MVFEEVKKDLRKFVQDHPIAFSFLVIYLGCLILYIIIYLILFADRSAAMSLNEIGDFLAGTFSPLAFLFLYLGYRQQGKEMQQNTDALRLQAEELKNSVNEQKKLMELHEIELREKHFSVCPYVSFDRCSNSTMSIQPENYYENSDITHENGLELYISFHIKCDMNTAYRVKVTNVQTGQIEKQFLKIPQGKSKKVSFVLLNNQLEQLVNYSQLDLVIHVEYYDLYGNTFLQKISFHLKEFEFGFTEAEIQMKLLNN